MKKKIITLAILFLKGCVATSDTRVSNKNENTQEIYQSRIVHGELAKIKDYPYHVYVMGETEECGGTIIGTRWIITAGHCISQPADMMKIFVSTENIHKRNRYNEYLVDEAYLHPDFRMSLSSDAYDCDCAILKLMKDLAYGPTVKSVKLGKSEDLVEGKLGDIAGYGKSEHDDGKLRVLHLPIMLYDSCTLEFNDYSVDENSEFCVGGADEGKTPCSGDSGGGFVADGKLLGVFISAQGDCGTGRRLTKPAIFITIPFTRQWISDITGIL